MPLACLKSILVFFVNFSQIESHFFFRHLPHADPYIGWNPVPLRIWRDLHDLVFGWQQSV